MSRYQLKQAVTGTVLATLGLTAIGCVYPEKQDFGDAVRHMQTVQTARPGAEVAPQDGQRIRSVLETYREDISQPQEIRNEITINVGEDD